MQARLCGFRCWGVSLITLCTLASAPCLGQSGRDDLGRLAEVNWKLDMFSKFGDWKYVRTTWMERDSILLRSGGSIHFLRIRTEAADVDGAWYSFGKVGSYFFPLSGASAPAVVEFANAARLLGRDSAEAVRSGATIARAFTNSPRYQVIVPVLAEERDGCASVVTAWGEAKATGVIDTLWGGAELGPRTFARDSVSRLTFVRFRALTPMEGPYWGVVRWTLAYGSSGELRNWKAEPAGTFVVPPGVECAVIPGK